MTKSPSSTPKPLEEFFGLCEEWLCVIRPDGGIELTNDALSQFIGVDAREPSDRRFDDLIQPEDRADAARAVEQWRRGDRARLVVRHRGVGGESRSVEWRGRVSPVSGLLFLIGWDITEAKRTEEALRASEIKLETLVARAAQGIVTVDAEGRIMTANPMAQRIFGYEGDELIGLHVETLLPESLREAHVAHRRHYLEAPKSRAMGQGLDLVGRRKDGSHVPVEISLSHIPTQHGSLTVALVSDITERKRAEEETRRLERRLEHATKMEAIGRLAGGIAHDFNNLLTALTGFSEIALEILPESHPLHEGARETYRTCQRSVSLVRRLLAVSRRQVLQPIILEVGAKLRELEKMLKGLLGEDIDLTVVAASGGLDRIKVDESQFEQVVLNLVVNARDAMPRGGSLRIETERRSLERRPYVAITVTDTGQGIDSDALPHIFEPFFTTRKQGTGLGLATAQGIVQQYGGRISVESTRGRGAAFAVFFPAALEDEPSRAVDAAFTPSARGCETVLVAEDENMVRLAAVNALTKAGYRVLEARDGEEAVRLATEHEGAVDLVLADVIMPRINGPEVFRRIREKHPEVKVLFMSGHARDALTPHHLEDGGYPFLAKPFTREALTSRVRRVLDDESPGN
ncbi:MAG TPA: PAS domain S-box protein [Vicinamibacteria bacterium]|nr:PAS domain S-box protein [Vicinamibacteria bacterium]